MGRRERDVVVRGKERGWCSGKGREMCKRCSGKGGRTERCRGGGVR